MAAFQQDFRLGLVGYYSDLEELFLEADSKALAEFAAWLEQGSGVAGLAKPGKTVAVPGGGELGFIKIGDGPGKLLIKHRGPVLTSTGSPVYFKILANDLRAFLYKVAQAEPGRERPHFHLEYYLGHEYLNATSDPLTLGLV